MAIEKRKLGGRDVNPVGLGCMSLAWAYGIPPTPEESARLLTRALDCGYDHLDTARIYGDGVSEALIGDHLHGRRKEFYLASKTGIVVDGDKRRIDCRPEVIRGALETSLKLLRTDYIDLYYLHRRDFTIPIEESVGALGELVRQGKIGGIGLSEMSGATVRRAHAEFPITAVQNEYSLASRNSEIAVLDACAELGIAFVAFSPLGRGPLGGTPGDPADLNDKDIRRRFPRFQPENWPHNHGLFEQFRALAAEAGVTPAQLSIAWVLSKGEHVHTIPGTASIPHMEENFATLAREIAPDILDRAEKLITPDTVAGTRYPPDLQQSIDTEEFA